MRDPRMNGAAALRLLSCLQEEKEQDGDEVLWLQEVLAHDMNITYQVGHTPHTPTCKRMHTTACW